MENSKLMIHHTTIDENNIVNVSLVDRATYHEYSSSSERIDVSVHIPEDAKFTGDTLSAFHAIALLKARKMLDEVILTLPAQETLFRTDKHTKPSEDSAQEDSAHIESGMEALSAPDKLKETEEDRASLRRWTDKEETKYWMIVGEEKQYEDPDKVSSYKVVSNKYIAFTDYYIERFKQNYPMHDIAFTLNITKELYYNIKAIVHGAI
jgi:hypothetical protein